MTSTRLVADRRSGSDRRFEPRRESITHVPSERRRVVDRRRGAERRSTLDRRGRPVRSRSSEAPGEHVRNALQLLQQLVDDQDLDGESVSDLAAAVERLRRALSLLERRPRTEF